MKKAKLRNIANILALIILITWFFLIDYNDLSWKNNAGAYLGIIAMVFLLLAGFLQRNKDKKNEN